MTKEGETPSPAGGGAQAGASNQDEDASSDGSMHAKPAGLERWFAVLFWPCLIVGLLVYWQVTGHADVYLDVSSTDTHVLSGVVLFDGKPVSSGKVVVETWDSSQRRLISSSIVEVGADGKFVTKRSDAPGDAPKKQAPLKIVASYAGTVPAASKDGSATKEVTGDCTLHLNQSPPISTAKWLIGGGLLLAILLTLVYLFTCELTEGPARTLFRLTYVVIVIALCAPIVLVAVAARSEPVVAAMEQAPVGLVRGRSEAVKQTQWLVNIGGAVRSHSPGGLAPVSDGSPAAESPAPARMEPGAGPEARAEEEIPYIEGGLVVPFFVLILALLGGAINMTRNVPAIQSKYQVATLPRSETAGSGVIVPILAMVLLRAPAAHLTAEQARVVSGIRRSLIAQYMFLLAAPFLAVTVYYLLQVVAREVEEPVLVLMSFATGIVSDKIVNGISAFAEGVLQTVRRGREESRGEKKQAGGKTPAPAPAPATGT